jgi:hypothetical protein
VAAAWVVGAVQVDLCTGPTTQFSPGRRMPSSLGKEEQGAHTIPTQMEPMGRTPALGVTQPWLQWAEGVA